MSTPRIANVDRTWQERVLPASLKARERSLALVAAEPDGRNGLHWFTLAAHTRGVADVAYATGAPLDEVRALYLACTGELYQGLSRRGVAVRAEQTEWFCGNSSVALSGLDMAMVAGDRELAAKIAALIWDPPGASYIGARSLLCTDREQALAYATRELIGGNVEAARAQLRRFPMMPKQLVGQAKMARGLIVDDAKLLLEGLGEALATHRHRALSKMNEYLTEYFLFMRGLGTSALALDRGIVTCEQLPQDNPYLPVRLIAG